MSAGGRMRRAGVDVLSPRALGRATLGRQLLLRRADLPVVTAVERVLGPPASHHAVEAEADRLIAATDPAATRRRTHLCT